MISSTEKLGLVERMNISFELYVPSEKICAICGAKEL